MLKRTTTEREHIMTKATNKAVIAAVAPVAAVAVITKADKARAVFADCYKDGKTTNVQRKDIIARLIGEAGLTKAGAGTYLQNMKDKAGITVKRTPVTA